MSASVQCAVTESTRRQAAARPPWLDGVTRLDDALPLRCGRNLESVDVAWRLVGEPDLPVVLVLGGISAGREVWNDEASAGRGWWQDQVGPGLALDTRRHRILAIDYLGGNGRTTSASSWSEVTGCNPDQFPAIDTRDQANLAARLLDELDVPALATCIGASYGGLVAQQFAAIHAHRLGRALVLSAGHQPSPMSTGWRHVQRQVLSLGIETGQVARAVGIARSLAMCTYRSDREFAERFVPAANGADSAVGYLDHCGEHFAARFDVHAYLCLSHSIDAHEIRPGEIGIPLDLAGFNSDQIVPVRQLVEFRRLLGGTGSLTLADSPFGHDAFLKENDAVSSVIRNHLETIR